MKVAFIGLGTMGYPMASHLLKAGYEVTVYNRTQSKAQAWVAEFGGRMAETPALAAQDAEFVFTCVGNDDDLRQVVIGEQGAFQTMAKNSVLVDHTTASAQVARELNDAAHERELHFLDAPISGGQAGAENGVLSIMAGGEEAVYARALPVLQAYGKSMELMGPVGAGQLTKMVNQICVVGLLEALAEGVHFAKTAGLDTEKVFGVLENGAAGSWQMSNRHNTMAENKFDFGFAVDWMRKDLGITLNEARNNGAQLPITAVVDQFYADLQRQGLGRQDISSLITRLERSN